MAVFRMLTARDPARSAMATSLRFQVAIIPGLEHEQRPERFSVVFGHREVFIDQRVHVPVIEQALSAQSIFAEMIQHKIPEIGIEPSRQRYSKTLFLPVNDGSGEESGSGSLEQVFRRQAVQF